MDGKNVARKLIGGAIVLGGLAGFGEGVATYVDASNQHPNAVAGSMIQAEKNASDEILAGALITSGGAILFLADKIVQVPEPLKEVENQD
jgi:hypothetical protein